MNTELNETSGVEIRDISLTDLHESPWNPRQHFPEAAMNELTESIRQNGFRRWLPLVVRPRVEGGYEIGAGHRRSRAAFDAGITSVPCIVREMTDAQFLDVLNFDNCGRLDVHPLHESAGWSAWMEKTGKGVVDIAARIGQSKEYVYQRLKYSALIDAGREAFLDGEISAGHAILIARLQPADQKKALKACEPPTWNPDQRPSVRDLVTFIQRDIHLDMARAAFDLEDESLLAPAGACSNCPKRTTNSPDLELSPGVGLSDDCTDPGCFHAKLGAHLVRIKQAMEATGIKPVEVSSSYGKVKKGLLKPGEYQQVAKNTPGATAAIIADGHDAGKVVHVKLTAKEIGQGQPGRRQGCGSCGPAKSGEDRP